MSFVFHNVRRRRHPRTFFRVIFAMWLAILILGFVAVLGLPNTLISFFVPCGTFRACEASAIEPVMSQTDDTAPAVNLAGFVRGVPDSALTRKQMVMYLQDMILQRGVIDQNYIASTSGMELAEFADIGKADSAYTASKVLFRRGILKGKKIPERPGIFLMPDDVIRRSEMVALLVRGLELPIVIDDDAPHFSDVGPDSWYYRYVETLYSAGALRNLDQFYGGYLATEGFLQNILEKL